MGVAFGYLSVKAIEISNFYYFTGGIRHQELGLLVQYFNIACVFFLFNTTDFIFDVHLFSF